MSKLIDCVALVHRGKDPTESCLRAAAAHIAHDLELLHLAWDQRHTRLGWTLWFLTARSLSDFFFVFERKATMKGTQIEYSDDMLAADFLPATQWRTTASELKKQVPSDWKDARRAANKLSAHLTYARLDKNQRGSPAPSPGVHRYLGGVAQVWLAALPAQRRVWFGAA